VLKLLVIAGVAYLGVRLYRAVGVLFAAKREMSDRGETVDKDRAVDAEFEDI
jgi:hypothetical protein